MPSTIAQVADRVAKTAHGHRPAWHAEVRADAATPAAVPLPRLVSPLVAAPVDGAWVRRRLLCPWLVGAILLLAIALAGLRVGEALIPGPDAGFDDSDFDGFPDEFSNDHLCSQEPWTVPSDVGHGSPEHAECVLEIGWAGDIGFSEEQLETWRTAETAVRLPTCGKREEVTRSASGEGSHAVPRACDAVNGHSPSPEFVGRIDGFIFTTGDHGTGYYRDGMARRSCSQRLILADLVPPPTPLGSALASMPQAVSLNTVSVTKPARARRAKLPDGRRRPLPSRRKRAILDSQCEGSGGACLPTGLIEDRWWPSKGLWAIDTANGNSWQTLTPAVVSRSKADVLLAQETKIFHTDRLEAAKITAMQNGWNPVLSAAHRTAAAMGTGGGAVMVRKGSGIADLTNDLIREGMRHRICISWVDAVVRGGIYMVSLYLRDSEGMSETNMALLEEVAAALSTLRGPWII